MTVQPPLYRVVIDGDPEGEHEAPVLIDGLIRLSEAEYIRLDAQLTALTNDDYIYDYNILPFAHFPEVTTESILNIVIGLQPPEYEEKVREFWKAAGSADADLPR